MLELLFPYPVPLQRSNTDQVWPHHQANVCALGKLNYVARALVALAGVSS